MVKDKRIKKKVNPMWMVLLRTYDMPGGVLDYGSANIIEFFETEKEAIKEAKKVFDRIKDSPEPFVWVMRIEQTHNSAGIAISTK